jgi:hypothetical protein
MSFSPHKTPAKNKNKNYLGPQKAMLYGATQIQTVWRK